MVGSITSDRIDAPGLTLRDQLGGSATYFALAARHFGPVAVIGAVGKDRETDLRATLGFADLSRLTVGDVPTATWEARRTAPDSDAETISSFDGAYRGYRPMTAGGEAWPRSVFLGSCHPEIQLAVAEQAPEGTLLGGDTMDIFIRDQRPLVERMVRAVRLLFVTETELRSLTGVPSPAGGASAALDRFPLLAVIVKGGAEGATLRSREGEDRLPAFPVTVVDPTGAGDALAGAFMGRLQELGGHSHTALLDALAWGVVAASHAIAAPGVAGLEALTRPDLEARLAKYHALGGLP